MSSNTLAVRDSQGDEKDAGLQNGNIAPNKTPIERNNVMKRKHFKKLQASEYACYLRYSISSGVNIFSCSFLVLNYCLDFFFLLFYG